MSYKIDIFMATFMSNTLVFILILYIAFRLKQFACDYLLQTRWMAVNKGEPGLDGYRPLAAHAGLHALATLAIMVVLAPFFWWLALVDFVLHGAIDRLKAVLTRHYGLETQHSLFWRAIGLDQEAHNFTHLGFIIIITLNVI